MKELKRLTNPIDAHVHLRVPGGEHKEDLETGPRAAIAGGITTVIDMPNNVRPTTTLEAINEKRRLFQQSLCQVQFYLGADQNNFTEFPRVTEEALGLKIYMDHTTGPLLVEDLRVLQNHFKFWPKEKPILVHAEDATLAKAIGLAMVYGKWLHVCHVSQACELELIKKAKKDGAKITCEVTPHHLFLTHEDESHLGSFGKMRPPLRTKKDQQALWQALNSGLIDIIASDHAPHTLEEKKSDDPPNGVPGLETTLPLMLTAVSEGRLTLEKLIELICTTPARLFGIDTSGSYTEIDLAQKWEIRNENLRTKCRWSPFNGWQVRGQITRVVIRNQEIFKDGEFL